MNSRELQRPWREAGGSGSPPAPLPSAAPGAQLSPALAGQLALIPEPGWVPGRIRQGPGPVVYGGDAGISEAEGAGKEGRRGPGGHRVGMGARDPVGRSRPGSRPRGQELCLLEGKGRGALAASQARRPEIETPQGSAFL